MFASRKTDIPGLEVIVPNIANDHRGAFVKTFNRKGFSEIGIDFNPEEEFFSISKKDVIRGIHFQVPPSEHCKLVYCIEGEILDVVVDLRTGNGYGMIHAQKLDSTRREILFVPNGCGHGFLTLSECAVVVYQTDKGYDASSDQGILWSSIDFEWPIMQPIVSERDTNHPEIKNFVSPFVSE